MLLGIELDFYGGKLVYFLIYIIFQERKRQEEIKLEEERLMLEQER